jgi:hypothetical protein
MPTTTDHDGAKAGGVNEGALTPPAEDKERVSLVTTDLVWRELAKTSFAVISYATPTGMPRSSGVVYALVGRRMFVAVADDSWKAKHIKASGRVAVTVPVRRGGIMSLLLPIPPATVSFHASAIVHPASSLEGSPLSKELAPLLPPERRASCRIIEIQPVGHFLTYGLGVSLMQMRSPTLARGRAPVG